MVRKGLRYLGKAVRTDEGASETQVQDLATFWQTICETEGSHKSHHPVIESWKGHIRDLLSEVIDSEALSREETW